MGEGETQYGVLIITSLVALAAITAMGLHTISYDAPAPAASEEQSSLVGAATTQLPPYSKLDYTADGVLDKADSQRLSEIIALGGCPPSRVCDVNGDEAVDLRDLARFNSLLSEPISPREEQPAPQPTPTGHVTSVPRHQPLPDVYAGEYPSAAILA